MITVRKTAALAAIAVTGGILAAGCTTAASAPAVKAPAAAISAPSQQASPSQPPASPPATPVATTAAPAVATAPAAPPADQIIARFSGTGMGTTGTFTVPADGNWHLSWAFTNGSLFAGQPENFQVYEYDASGALVAVLVNSLAIGDGTPTATPVYGDADAGSQVHFQVNTEDAGWSIVPVSGIS